MYEWASHYPLYIICACWPALLVGVLACYTKQALLGWVTRRV